MSFDQLNAAAWSKKMCCIFKMDLVHNLKGKIVVYCLECEPDAEGRPFRYVGCTNNCERRMAEHMGMKEGGAAWCKSHKPVDVISVRVCNTKEELSLIHI